MTLIYKRNLPKDLVMPKMRTEVPYRTPSIYRDSGQYFSKTFWYPKDYISCSVEIHLVWFNGLGWYNNVQLESHWDAYTEKKKPCPPGRKIFEIDFGRRGEGHSKHWCDGFMLPLCAEDADNEARYLITELRGLKMPTLAPYVTKVKNEYGDRTIANYEAYLDAGQKLNPIPFI